MSATDRITVTVEDRSAARVVVVGGEIDLNTAPTLEAAVADALTCGPAGIVVDLSAVDFMGSVGLRILVTAREQIGGQDRFAVVANGPATRRPIELTGLAETLPLYSTLDAALAALHPGSG